MLAQLVYVALRGLRCLGTILLEITHGEEWPSRVVAGLHGLDPCGLDWVTTHCMHPLDGLFGGWEIVNAVGLAHRLLGLFGWAAGLPLPALL